MFAKILVLVCLDERDNLNYSSSLFYSFILYPYVYGICKLQCTLPALKRRMAVRQNVDL